MDLPFGFQTKHNNKMKGLLIDGLGFHGDFHFLVIRLHNSWIMKLLARAVILAMIIVSFPWLKLTWSNLMHQPSKISDVEMVFDSMSVDLLPLVFRDLANDGLLRKGDRALFVTRNGNVEAVHDSRVFTDYNMDLVSFSDMANQPEESYDFAFAHGFTASSGFVNRALKVGGIFVLQLTDNPALEFHKPENYRIVYLRKFKSTIVAMKKTGHTNSNSNSNSNSTPKRQLQGIESEAARVAALKNLEAVLLEPPRAASGKSSTYSKRTRYLPDLMGVSLESYPRRVFIDASQHGQYDASAWFKNHYPSRNTKFEIFQIEAVTESASPGPGPRREVSGVISMSDWVRKNVEEKDYVVMKTEVEVAEEMVKSRAIKLVDELFLECNHNKGIRRVSGEKNRRAYWECLALYGLLRDEGVAVHQWWG